MNGTDQKSHWFWENKYSNVQEDTYKEQVVLDTISSNVEKIVEKLNSSEITMSDNLLSKEKNRIDRETCDSCKDIAYSFSVPEVINKSHPFKKNYISSSQSWIGYVMEISGDSFKAKLNDLINTTTYEIAEFNIKNDVNIEDKKFISIGAIFYWSIGYAHENGQSTKQSIVRFKRSVPFTEEEVDKIVDNANLLHDKLNWD